MITVSLSLSVDFNYFTGHVWSRDRQREKDCSVRAIIARPGHTNPIARAAKTPGQDRTRWNSDSAAAGDQLGELCVGTLRAADDCALFALVKVDVDVEYEALDN